MNNLKDTTIKGILRVFGQIRTNQITGSLIGNSDTSTKFAASKTINLTGDATGTGTGDFGTDFNIPVTIADDSHNHTVATVTGVFGVPKGGTGRSAISANAMLYASAADTYAEIATTVYGRSLLAAVSGTKFTGFNADQVDGVHVDDTQSTASYLWTASKVKAYVDSLLASNDAMIFKGTLGTGGTVTSLPTTGYNAGWSYKVITAGTYAGVVCQVGDMVICVKDYVSSYLDSDWTVVQTNIDGAVTNSDTSVTDGHVVIFNGTTGKIIKTSNKALPSGNIVGDTSYGTSATGGVVKSSSTNNYVTINADGTMTVNTIDIASNVTGVLAVSHGGTAKSTIAANSMLYASALDTYSEVTTTAYGRSLLAAVSGTKFAGFNADSVDGVHVDDTQSTTSYLWTASKTKAYADSLLASNDAMVFKGTLGTGGTVTTVPTSGYYAGWTYKVITAGTYAGNVCQIGDMIICVKDYVTYTDTDWAVIQTNIDGAVTNSDTSVTDGHVPIFNGATGKIIKTSGKALPAGNIVGDTSYGTTSSGGVVKSSSSNNQVSIDASGLMTVNTIDAATKITGTLAVGHGGTGTTTAPTQGGIIYGASTSTHGSTAAGTSGQVLKSNGTSAPTWQTLDMSYLPDATFKKSVVVATTSDIGASTKTSTTLTGYNPSQSLACTTTAGSTTVTTTSTAGLKVGAVINAATAALAAGMTVASITNATTFVINNRASIATTAITGNGSTATATFVAQTYAPYAVGSTITITGATPTTYNGTFTVTACTTTSVSWASTVTTTATVQGSIAFTIKAGTSITTAFTQSIAALSVDGITLAVNDRVLIKNQTTLGGIAATANVDNGIYYLSTLGSTSVAWVLTRAADADTSSKIASALVAVDKGSTNGGFLFDTDFRTTDTLGSTAMTWNAEADNAKKLNFFASTTSAELASIISDETGSGKLVFGTSPTIGTPTITGNLTMSDGGVLLSNNTAVNAAGTTQATATALTKDLNCIFSGSGGVVLPAIVTGRVIRIANNIPAAINVYPASGASIDTNAANTPITLQANSQMIFYACTSTKWESSLFLSTDWSVIQNKPTTGTTAGTGTAYTYTDSTFTLKDGAILVLKLNVANEKGATLNVNSTGAKAIIDTAGKPIAKGFAANSYITLVYNGTNYVIQGGGSSSGAGGITINAADLAISNSIDVGIVGGSRFSYTTTANTAAANIITTTLDDLVYGTYSIMLRIALTSISNTNALLKIETYHYNSGTGDEILLNTATLKPSDFAGAGSYEVFGFNTEFKGGDGDASPKLRIKVSILSNSTANTLYFDYFRIAPTYTTIYSLPTT